MPPTLLWEEACTVDGQIICPWSNPEHDIVADLRAAGNIALADQIAARLDAEERMRTELQ